MILNKFSDFYKKFEKYISPIGLIYGFIFTFLTLTRVDMFLENFWIVVHLLIAGFGILAVTLFENRADKKQLPEADREKFHFYLTLIIQFAFGGLFSTFFVFYMRSSSLADSWFFLLLLLVLLVGNELWKKHYQRLAFQVSVLFISLYLFLVFLLPVIFHRIGTDLFLASGIVSLLLIFLFTLLLRRFSHENFKRHHNVLKVSIISIFVLMNVLYFTNVIPPIPLSLKEAGVYHTLVKDGSNYQVTTETKSWLDFFTRYPVIHLKTGDRAYVFSAIFSPVRFNTEIVHLWQHYDEVTKEWVNSGVVNLAITGGREGGFRTYSWQKGVKTGLWRVKVMTASGKTLGNVKFRVEQSTSTPALITKTL
jgi:hypothetical protein